MSIRAWLQFLLLFPAIATGCPLLGADEKVSPHQERIKWFNEAKFGMFIHWGLYSAPGEGERIMSVRKIPAARYERLATKFNPTAFNAKAWVNLARRAGMKYIVITAKHHDGFCMFDSRLTDYNVVKATPFKRDVIAEVTRECRRQGIKIGFYYSILDWHHPDYMPAPSWDRKNPGRQDADFNRYLKYMEGQLRELCTRYGKIDIIWYDGGWDHQTIDDNAAFAHINSILRRLQPSILINNRSNLPEDFETPDQYLPATGLTTTEGKPTSWEACLTLSTGHGSFPPTAWWGYDKNEKEFKSRDEIIRTLVDVVSKGGNLLLNVGPMTTGNIQPECISTLEGVGRWLRSYGVAIYGTTPGPFRHVGFWGAATSKENKLYLHLFDWPANRKLYLPGLKYETLKAGYFLTVPDQTFDLWLSLDNKVSAGPLALQPVAPLPTVAVLEFTQMPEVQPFENRPDRSGTLHLPILYAELHGQPGQRAKYLGSGDKVWLGSWTNLNDYLTWEFELPQPRNYQVWLEFACPQDAAGGEVAVSVGENEFKAKIASTGSATTFKTIRIGALSVPGGKQTLALKAVTIPAEKEILLLRGMVLKPSIGQ